jgi:excinuclease ABC subunit A
VTGVSGSGKSTLVKHTLYPALRHHLTATMAVSERTMHCVAQEAVRRVLEVDHTPIGKTPRSNPATVCGLL